MPSSLMAATRQAETALTLALALARLRTSTSVLVVGGLAVLSAVYGGFWLNGSGPP